MCRADVRLLAAATFVLAGLGTASAQGRPRPPAPEPAVAEKAGKELHGLRIHGRPPVIDGRLDDDVWADAPAIEDFVQDEPDNLQPPTEHTSVQVAYDGRYVYVAAYCYAKDLTGIRTGLGRRDDYPPSDAIAISFDPRHDHQTAYTFRVNASGVQGDFANFDDTGTNIDYDGVWAARTEITAQGWTAEFRIPFSQMRFALPPEAHVTWGFQARRDIQNRGEFDRWVPKPRGQQGDVSRFGHLIFDERLTPPRRLELIPFTLSQSHVASGASARQTVSAGLDLRVGLGTAATISATINPDFGQIEADPSVLNLSVFETFFPEKRSFFLEDSRTFVLPYGQFPDFYSRRIGQAPGRIALQPGDQLVSQPDNTTIIGAMKITGKASGWTYGGLTALTSREYATVETTEGTGRVVTTRQRLIEPLTSYNVGRVQRDVLHGSSNVGVIGTAVVREGDADGFTGGPDFNLRWDRNLFALSGHWVGTRARVADTMETGFGGVTNFSYSGKHLGVDGHYDHFGRTFHNSDLGFLGSRSNKNEVNGGANLRQPDPWGFFRDISLFVNAGRQWNDEGVVFGKYVGGGLGNATFANFWNMYFNAYYNPRKLDDLDTRGGPPIVKPAEYNVNAGFGSDSRRRWKVSTNLSLGRDVEGGWNTFIGPSLRLQASARLQASLSANFTSGKDPAQWIVNTDADGDGQTDSVYGTLRRRVVSITSRTTYAFSRDLTLEAFVQPFVAVGAYTNIRKLAHPSSFDFEPVTLPDDPAFNQKSVRGTTVLRWEYKRGSTLFFVWNLSTLDTSRPGVFTPGRDLADAFTGPSTNVFAVKISYWFTP